jgi:hypothetical protein
MSEQPSTHGSNGDDRGNNGRFRTGNKLGRGNPLAGRAARIRAILLKALTPTDAKAIAAKLIAQAKGGDLAAIRELLDRTIGKPATSDLLERIEALEAGLEKGTK